MLSRASFASSKAAASSPKALAAAAEIRCACFAAEPDLVTASIADCSCPMRMLTDTEELARRAGATSSRERPELCEETCHKVSCKTAATSIGWYLSLPLPLLLSLPLPLLWCVFLPTPQ